MIVTKFLVATVLTMVSAAILEPIAALIAGGGVSQGAGPPGRGATSQRGPISGSKLALGLFVGRWPAR